MSHFHLIIQKNNFTDSWVGYSVCTVCLLLHATSLVQQKDVLLFFFFWHHFSHHGTVDSEMQMNDVMKTIWFRYFKTKIWFFVRTSSRFPTLNTSIGLEPLNQQVRASVAAILNLHFVLQATQIIHQSSLCVCLIEETLRDPWFLPPCSAPANGCVWRVCVGADLAAHPCTLWQHRLHSSHPCFQLAWKSSAVLRGRESRVETILQPRR